MGTKSKRKSDDTTGKGRVTCPVCSALTRNIAKHSKGNACHGRALTNTRKAMSAAGFIPPIKQKHALWCRGAGIEVREGELFGKNRVRGTKGFFVPEWARDLALFWEYFNAQKWSWWMHRFTTELDLREAARGLVAVMGLGVPETPLPESLWDIETHPKSTEALNSFRTWLVAVEAEEIRARQRERNAP